MFESKRILENFELEKCALMPSLNTNKKEEKYYQNRCFAENKAGSIWIHTTYIVKMLQAHFVQIIKRTILKYLLF